MAAVARNHTGSQSLKFAGLIDRVDVLLSKSAWGMFNNPGQPMMLNVFGFIFTSATSILAVFLSACLFFLFSYEFVCTCVCV